MSSGIQELLLIVVIALGIFLIPRMMKPHPPPTPAKRRAQASSIPWAMRLAIVLSILWPAVWALHIKPWARDLTAFLAWGIGPVIVGWSIKWVLAGFKNKR